MNRQTVTGGKVIHFDITRHCSTKPKQKRDLTFECHLHKAIIWQRLQMAFSLIMGRPIHLVMTGVRVQIGDRVVSEIEL